VKYAPASMLKVVHGLQALRGVAHISVVTIAAELGTITSRFETARRLMGYNDQIKIAQAFDAYHPISQSG
jgi:transposase